MGVQVGQILRQAALRTPERVALIEPRRDATGARVCTSYAELDGMARRVAARLLSLGVTAGERVGLMGDNSRELVAAWFGIVYAGGTVVPLPPSSAAPEVTYRLTHAQCKQLVHDAARAELATQCCNEDALGCVPRALAELCAGPAGASDLREGHEHHEHHEHISALPHPHGSQPEDCAMVLYTSGTTGKAKGAAISHASLTLHTLALVHYSLQLTQDDVVLCALPLTHSFGCRIGLLAPMLAGCPVVLVPKFSARATLELMQREGVTFVPAVPTMFAAWSEVSGDDKPTRLKWALSAGAPLPDELARRAQARLGAEVRQGYGMTEATFSTLNAPPDALALGSVGRPAWGVEVRVVDEQGCDVAPGESGEVVVRGQNLMTHYLFDPEASLEVAPDGFVRSGDIGRFDAEGRLYIVDRRKDLIIRGGFNVYPSEVEDVLAAHASVAQVAVIGRPDAFYGEEIVAVIVLRAEQPAEIAALSQWASQRLSQTKWPRHYAFVSGLPLGASGKVHKRELRKWLEQGKLSLHDASAPK